MSHSSLTRSPWGAWSKPLSHAAWTTSPAWTMHGPAWIMLTSLLPALPAPSPRLMGHIWATLSLLRQESNKALISGGCTSHLGLTSLLLPFSSPPKFNTRHHPPPRPGLPRLCSLTLEHIPPKHLYDSLSHLTHHPAQTSRLKGAAWSLSDVHFSLSIYILTFSFPALSIPGNTSHLPVFVKNIYMFLYLSSQTWMYFP